MKRLLKLAVVTATATSYAHASSGGGNDGESFLLIFFLAFGGIIIACQLFPGLALFSSMLKSLFVPSPKTE